MNTLSQLASSILPHATFSSVGDKGILSISGNDGRKFLQGQTTCDVNKLSESTGLYGAICNIKGRIIVNFFALQQEETILLVMDKGLVEKVANHLKKYAVFFKVTLSDVSESYSLSSSFAAGSDSAPALLNETLEVEMSATEIGFAISHYPVKTTWILSKKEAASETNASPAANVLNLLAARPLITADQSEEILPQWLNMQRTGGISFKKGCYTGQEIVARMQYRGKSKKQLALFTWQDDISAEKDITDGEGKSLGQVFQVAQFENTLVALVVLNIDPTEAQKFMLGQTSLEHLPLPYQLEKTEA